MDNFIMIQAGGLIDSTICVQFGLATMTAAAMGQVVSDVSGVMFGGALESFLQQRGIAPISHLTVAQRSLAICQRVRMTGAALGVMIGCALGATSLLLLDLDRPDADHGSSTHHREEEELRHVLSHVFELNNDLKSDFCTLYLVDPRWNNCKSIKGKLDVKTIQEVEASSHVDQCYKSKSSLVDNNHRELKPNDVLRSILCVPVQTNRGEWVGVLELKNKRPDERGISHFTKQDEAMGKLLGNHVGILFDQLGSGGGSASH